MKLILDSSAVIAFCKEMNRPELLILLIEKGHTLVIPDTVHEEIRNGISMSKLSKFDLSKIVFMSTDKAKVDFLQNKYPYLGKGEVGVMVCGKELQGSGEPYLCVFDEKKARNIAKEKEGLSITGTKGLLDFMKNSLYLSDADYTNLQKILKESSFRW